ncbi:acyltransferase [Patescibacteria group bacterium]|nr:acyltransferase [Patescibacteria group bacterium]
MSTIEYLKTKAKVYFLWELILLELEAYFVWPFRGLPSFLGFLTRFLVYKIFFKRLDSFCVIQPNVFFVHCFRIECGKNFAVNSNTYINAVGGVEIGDDVLIGANVVISSGEHQYKDAKTPVTLQKIVPKKITIGNGVWIGANVVVMPGVTLAEGTVVGAGAVVTKSTEPFCVVVGVPAKKIKSRID